MENYFKDSRSVNKNMCFQRISLLRQQKSHPVDRIVAGDQILQSTVNHKPWIEPLCLPNRRFVQSTKKCVSRECPCCRTGEKFVNRIVQLSTSKQRFHQIDRFLPSARIMPRGLDCRYISIASHVRRTTKLPRMITLALRLELTKTRTESTQVAYSFPRG